jgi:GNAT superfamily N-acetyltransferase
MEIRPATPDEADILAGIHQEAARVAYAEIFRGQPFPEREALERWRTFTGRVLVAQLGAQVVGFVAFDDTELHALYVLPGHQRAGIGSSLLAASGDVSRAWVLKDNSQGRAFYEARGWRLDGSECSPEGVIEVLYRRAASEGH